MELKSEAPKQVAQRVMEDAYEAAFAATMRTRPHDTQDLDKGVDITFASKSVQRLQEVDPAAASLASHAAAGLPSRAGGRRAAAPSTAAGGCRKGGRGQPPPRA